MRPNRRAYRPVPVETVLGQPDVALIGPDGTVVKQAPTAADLYGKSENYWLDLPGDPLNSGCSYEQWFNRVADGKPTTAYAHLVEEDGKLALQYCLIPVNDGKTKHEGDGDDHASSTRQGGRKHSPDHCASRYSARGPREPCDRRKRERRDGHPVLRGAGRTRFSFVQALYLGHRPDGFGCDKRAVQRVTRRRSRLLQSKDGSDDPLAWLGDLVTGEKRCRTESGPTGPTFKGQGGAITWVDENGGDASRYRLAPSRDGDRFFCTAVARDPRYTPVPRNPFWCSASRGDRIARRGSLGDDWSPALPIRSQRRDGGHPQTGFASWPRRQRLIGSG